MTDSSPKDEGRSEQTRIVHPEDRLTPGFEAFPVPVTRASTIVFPNLAAMRKLVWSDDSQWRYGLHGTPTSITLAQRLAAIEGGEHALLHPSGLSAISNVYFGFVKSGDHVLVPDNAYSPNREHADWLAADYGVEVTYYDPMIGAGIADLIRPNTKLVWVEAPGSVTMEVQDVPAIAAVARARGVVTALDNTYSAGLAFKPFEHGVDISVQALSKYQSGGSDILMGATIAVDREHHMKLKRARMRLGIGVSADDCSLVLRSLPSMTLRYAAHDRTAFALATWLKTRPEVAAVLHPAIEDCPGHEIFRRDFKGGAGGLFSFVFDKRYSAAQVDAFVEALELFDIGWSWGGSHSLAMPYNVSTMRTAAKWPHEGVLVRFFVGLEDEADLRRDIEQALTKAFA
ncbi:cystathionine beta-lyase [Caballeronia arationis]|uniref:Cystathionine beta-lyase n=1 Tax=Caballeronia arationis TaxID=1777142 RepID=A0A7Z7I9N0_9BURK|nr:cystathionine beta-lyase [Caballeronia arationis]SAK87830.1 cystathionine beta-lyase [Caballeronia arationis]SOE81859.1 cystathionine beta-lyase [Caballeronia arationis]